MKKLVLATLMALPMFGCADVVGLGQDVCTTVLGGSKADIACKEMDRLKSAPAPAPAPAPAEAPAPAPAQ